MSLVRLTLSLFKARTERKQMDKVELMGEELFSYGEFWPKIEEIDADPSKKPLMVIFKANDVTKGISWCPDCNEFEKNIRELQKSNVSVGYQVRVHCGDRETWRNAANPFRTDDRLQIETVPTLIDWATKKRISGLDVVKLDKLREFFLAKK